jgi:hypothetical protein
MDSLIDMRALLDGVEPLTLALWMCAILLVLVLIGVRVAFAAAFVGFWACASIFMQRQGFDRGLVTALKLAGQVPHSKSSGYALSLIPTFIVIGYLAYYAGLTRALFEMAKRWVGWVPGGLGVATVFATAGFAAVSGASVATSAVFARIAIPEMLKLNYDKAFAAGVVAAGGTLASLIPPSAILVIYAIIVEESVGKLLLAGFLPGFVSALIYAALVIGLAKTRKDLGPPVTGYTWGERFASLPGALPIFFVIFIIIFSIYYRGEDGAWATPTEAGALGAFVVLVHGRGQGDEARPAQDRADGGGQAHGDDLRDDLGRPDLRAVPRLRPASRRVRGVHRRAGDVALPDPSGDPAGLCGARHVHGRDRDADPDAARHLPSDHRAQRRAGRHARDVGLRHDGGGMRDLVRDHCRQDGGALSDHAAHRAQLLRRGGRGQGHRSCRSRCRTCSRAPRPSSRPTWQLSRC